jgi:hypothetical protein
MLSSPDLAFTREEDALFFASRLEAHKLAAIAVEIPRERIVDLIVGEHPDNPEAALWTFFADAGADEQSDE